MTQSFVANEFHHLMTRQNQSLSMALGMGTTLQYFSAFSYGSQDQLQELVLVFHWHIPALIDEGWDLPVKDITHGI
jgi:hypothetical protein